MNDIWKEVQEMFSIYPTTPVDIELQVDHFNKDRDWYHTVHDKAFPYLKGGCLTEDQCQTAFKSRKEAIAAFKAFGPHPCIDGDRVYRAAWNLTQDELKNRPDFFYLSNTVLR